MNKIYLPIILGTTREGRMSELAAKAVEKIVVQISEDITTEIIDPRNLNLPEDGTASLNPDFQDKIKRADGFIFVTPEYNHSFPPSLKRILDAEKDLSPYRIKPAIIAGVSSGMWGGVRVIEALLPVLRALDIYVGSRDIHFYKVQEQFDESGELLNPQIATEVEKAVLDLVKKAKILKSGRESLVA